MPRYQIRVLSKKAWGGLPGGYCVAHTLELCVNDFKYAFVRNIVNVFNVNKLSFPILRLHMNYHFIINSPVFKLLLDFFFNPTTPPVNVTDRSLSLIQTNTRFVVPTLHYIEERKRMTDDSIKRLSLPAAVT